MLPNIVAGGGIGLLLGYLLGLSVSPIVQGVVVAITGLLGAFLGLQSGDTAGRSWRIGSFGFLCVAGVTLGLSVRTGSLMAPSVKAEVARWVAAGYSKPTALAYVAYQRLGVKPAGVAMGPAPEAKQTATALYAADSHSACNAIGLLNDPAQQLAMARRMGFAAAANAASATPDPDATLMRLLKCGG